jgi:hypothetical protein
MLPNPGHDYCVLLTKFCETLTLLVYRYKYSPTSLVQRDSLLNNTTADTRTSRTNARLSSVAKISYQGVTVFVGTRGTRDLPDGLKSHYTSQARERLHKSWPKPAQCIQLAIQHQHHLLHSHYTDSEPKHSCFGSAYSI